MRGTESIDIAEQLFLSHEQYFSAMWAKPRLLDSRVKARSYSARLDEEFPRVLNGYSRSVLNSIVFGGNDANENKLLREIYWRTIEKLAL